MPPAIVNYPSLETVMNLVRSIVNDAFAGATDTPGEGQIVTDNPAISPFTPSFLSAAVREMYRKLRNAGEPELIYDNYIMLAIPVVNGTQGPAIQDATVQVQFTFDGYNPGNGVINTNFTLPPNMIMPLRIWERINLSNDIFHDMSQPQFGLEPCLQQNLNRMWEVRAGAVQSDGTGTISVFMPGATQLTDQRWRYLAAMPQFLDTSIVYSSTYIPIQDCEDYVAHAVASKILFMLGADPTQKQQIEAWKADALNDLKTAWVRRAQTVDYHRESYGDDGSGGPQSGGGYLSIQ